LSWWRRVTTARLEIPPRLIPVFAGPARYRGAYGGRGSAKTRTFALMTAVRAYQAAEAGERGVILCGREFMNSLDDSSMEEVKQAISAVPWLDAYFDCGEKYIRTRNRRVSYTFAGLRHSLDSLKGKARILIAWIDEAESVSETAWLKLGPTVRAGLENDDIGRYMVERLPGIERHTVRADSARPETISHVKSDGGGRRTALPKIVGADKWPGSVEDGIAHLRAYKEIVIHPRCAGFLHEARTYSYKVDRLTGDVLASVVDAHNHYIDATRYALGPLIKRSRAGVFT
jgi:phage terminase large subunit